MKDYLKNELALGDRVVVTRKDYRGFVKGHIIKFTPQQVRVVYMNTWNYGKPGREEEYLVYPDNVIKIGEDQ